MRLLQPLSLLATADAVWLLDGFQPVAARLDPVDGRLLGLVDWRHLPAPTVPQRPAAADPDRLWVQWGDTLLSVTAEGVRSTTGVAGLTLLAAGGPGAWLGKLGAADIGDPHRGVPAPPLPGGLLALVTPDGARRDITLDRPPVRRAVATAEDLRLQVRLSPPTPVPQGERAFGFDYHQVTVALPWAALRGPSIVVGDHEQVPFDAPPMYISWMSGAGPGWRAGDRIWRAGRLAEPQRHDRDVVAAGYDADGVEHVRVPLGRGHVVAGLLAHGRLWFALRRRGRGCEVLTVDPDTGAVVTVVGPGGIDISDRTWTMPAVAPPEVAAHADRWLDRLADLDRFWHPEDGSPVRPLAGDMSDAVAELDGRWPDLAVQVTFRHPWFPDGLLRRRIPLFDELGRPVEPEYCDVHLMEDVECRHLPPVTEAVDGVLNI